MRFRLFLPWTVALLCAVSAAAVPPAAAQGIARPNIVLVLTDDQRWDTLDAMPTVRRELVGKGVTFANAFAVNPLCCPSRASFLTGLYSHSTRVYDNAPPYGGVQWFDDSSTLATWLAASGYRTGFVGKYLNGYQQDFVPLGWHRWVGYAGGYLGYSLNIDGFVVPFGSDEASYSTDVLTRAAVSFVEESGDPFLLVYAPFAPHGPATPAARHADAFTELAPWRPPNHDEADVSDKPAWVRALPPVTDESNRGADGFRRRQLASLLAVDDGVDALLAALRSSGRLENTVLVFASDNGLLWGEHRQAGRKVAAYEESIRIPLVVRYDALTRARTERRLVTNIDVAPTLAELAGAPAPRVDGRSLVPLLDPARATTARWRDAFLVEHRRGRGPVAGSIPTYCAVRGTRFKYVVYSTREEELYDLVSDPFELTNRADDPSLRTLVPALRLRLKRLCEPPPPGFDLRWLCTQQGDEGVTALAGTRWGDTICGRRTGEAIDALGGDDVVRGAGGSDTVLGRLGDDDLDGGPGRDVLDGGPGDDVVRARDRWRDRVDCGAGLDVVRANPRDAVDRDCERVVRGEP